MTFHGQYTPAMDVPLPGGCNELSQPLSGWLVRLCALISLGVHASAPFAYIGEMLSQPLACCHNARILCIMPKFQARYNVVLLRCFRLELDGVEYARVGLLHVFHRQYDHALPSSTEQQALACRLGQSVRC